MKILNAYFDGATFKLGKQGQERARFANDGPIHVAMLGEHWVAVWHDDDDVAILKPREKVRDMQVPKAELLSALAEREPPHEAVNGVTVHSAKPAPEAVGKTVAAKK